jgi:hypothetical protein
MRLSFRAVGLLLALAGGSLAPAVEPGIGQVAATSGEATTLANDVAEDSIDVTGSIGATASARLLPLTDEERGHIFDGIMRIRDVPEASVPEAAAAMPGWVALQDLPASVTSDIPMVQGCKFVKLYDRIVLVRPTDRTVVAVMPRYKLVLD